MLWFRQYYLGCLSHASYLVGDTSTGRAVVVDPQRDIDEYLRDAEANGLRIERVIETHFHADFLSGHLELAEATGRRHLLRRGGRRTGRVRRSSPSPTDSDLSLGEVELEIRATPGHTPESISIVVREHAGDTVPYGVLTGDTLFIGDVGRPDLLVSIGHTAEELGCMLYHSLHEQLLTLPDATRVYPAHGAGSACGKNLSTETESTIGAERATNYALQPMSEDEFVQVVTEGQPAAPPYFLFAATRNRQQRDLLREQGITPMTLAEVLDAQRAGAAVLDTRDQVMFAAGHLKGSIDVGLDGRFAEYTGDVLDPRHTDRPRGRAQHRGRGPDPSRPDRVRQRDRRARRLRRCVHGPSRAGRAGLAPHRRGARRAARDACAVCRSSTSATRARSTRRARSRARCTSRCPQLVGRIDELDPTEPTVVYCAGGYRSTIAASTLRAHGLRRRLRPAGGHRCMGRLGQRARPAGTAG